MNRRFPETLKNRPVWVLWKIEERDGKPTKVPWSPKYKGRAKADDPTTWGTFSEAVARFKTDPLFYEGVGVEISKDDRLIFIDIDHCINEDGELDARATDILDVMVGQYVEVSVSGSGIHILTLGEIPRNFKNTKTGIEMYAEKRFCALTGNVLGSGEPFENPDGVDYVFNRYKTPDKQKTPVKSTIMGVQKGDAWIIEKARGKGRFDDLYAGRWEGLYSSQSEADLSLCLILAFWCDRDCDQMDRVFRSSGLNRPKWENRQDYREATLQSAVAECRDTYSEYRSRKQKEGDDQYAKTIAQYWKS